MKLIDAPIGIFRFDGELVLKTEYCSENKLSGKYIPDCYIVRTGEYFWGGAKTANELNNLDVEPVDFAELLPIVTDTISRQAAIDGKICIQRANGVEIYDDYSVPVEYLEQLPPAQPERIRGRWIPVGGALYQCDQCGVVSLKRKFCSECGADMREVTT